MLRFFQGGTGAFAFDHFLDALAQHRRDIWVDPPLPLARSGTGFEDDGFHAANVIRFCQKSIYNIKSGRAEKGTTRLRDHGQIENPEKLKAEMLKHQIKI